MDPLLGLILSSCWMLWGDATETASALFVRVFWKKKGRVSVNIMRPLRPAVTQPKTGGNNGHTKKQKPTETLRNQNLTHTQNTKKSKNFLNTREITLLVVCEGVCKVQFFRVRVSSLFNLVCVYVCACMCACLCVCVKFLLSLSDRSISDSH